MSCIDNTWCSGSTVGVKASDMLVADFIAENWFLQILLFEFTIVASEGYMRAFQMSNFKNKNCSELLLTNGMGLDGAPIKFLTFKISPLKVRPPSA